MFQGMEYHLSNSVPSLVMTEHKLVPLCKHKNHAKHETFFATYQYLSIDCCWTVLIINNNVRFIIVLRMVNEYVTQEMHCISNIRKFQLWKKGYLSISIKTLREKHCGQSIIWFLEAFVASVDSSAVQNFFFLQMFCCTSLAASSVLQLQSSQLWRKKKRFWTTVKHPGRKRQNNLSFV